MYNNSVEIIPPPRSSSPATRPPQPAPSLEELIRRARQHVPKGEFHQPQ